MQIKTIRDHWHMRCYGSHRMIGELRETRQRCSKNRVVRLIRIHGLRARPRRPFRPKTTVPDHADHPSPTLLAKAGPPMAPGVQIVSDIDLTPEVGHFRA